MRPRLRKGYDPISELVLAFSVKARLRNYYNAPETMRGAPLLIATIGLAITAASAIITSAEDASMVQLPVEGQIPSLARQIADGYGAVSRQRTYQLIRQLKPIVDRQVKIEFFEAPVEAFDFTFG
ncbi:MAG: hypothetical protein WCC84_02320 [Candidatus Cybelea sp.]